MGLRDLISLMRRLPDTVSTVLQKFDLVEQQIDNLRKLVERININLAADLVAERRADRQKLDELPTILEKMRHLLNNEIKGAATYAQGSLANSLNATENVLVGRLSLMHSQIETFAPQIAAISEMLAGFEHRTSTRNGEISNEINALQNAVLLGHNDLASLAGSRHGAMANEINAILNAVLPQTLGFQAVEQRLEQLARSFVEMREIDAGLNMLMARSTSALIARIDGRLKSKTMPVLPPNPITTLAEQMAAMRLMAPNNFSTWYAAYERGVAEGLRTREGNLSHEGHIGAGHFRMFINVHARGRVLDVGCGPIALPSYLNDWPIRALAGLDPQLPFEPHSFPFAQSFAETIPWPDASFETVVIGTSLDHIYLLDQALAEVKRVLVPDGRLLIWTAIFDETPLYMPKGPKFTPPDSYHLFHPGRNWFYELFRPDYRMIERLPSVANAELVAYELIAP
jgi:SAM-dependent methyltransferase